MIVFMSISCQKTTSPEEMVTFIKSYGGQYMDAGYEVIQSSDGGYVIADYTESSANNKDVHVFKVDSEGNLVWKRTIVSSDNEVAYDIKQTPDGGYIVAGETSSDALLIKLDSQGNVQWQKTIGGTAPDGARTVTLTDDGGYILCGYTYSMGAGNADLYLAKTDASGNVQWERAFGGTDRDGDKV